MKRTQALIAKYTKLVVEKGPEVLDQLASTIIHCAMFTALLGVVFGFAIVFIAGIGHITQDSVKRELVMVKSDLMQCAAVQSPELQSTTATVVLKVQDGEVAGLECRHLAW